ncbi:DUF305 domain-containing protein [Actinokineospora sp.]|uniref:DUF305 domain-containing protein n=1 Tax=Actinokineospora sp. TaxID=1872133 RepID=UPI004037A7FF
MMWRRTVAAVLAGVLVAAGAAACAESGPPPNPVLQPGKPGESNKTLSADEAAAGVPTVQPNDADAEYVQMMIVHHGQAVEMTALVPERGQNAQVKGLADRIANTQQPEIDAMNRWLAQHGKPTVGADHGGHGGHRGHDMPGMATADQLARLKAATGAEFDTLFLRLMITHHEGALTMATTVQQAGVDVRVQEMANDVIAEQTDEIRRMRGMLAG